MTWKEFKDTVDELLDKEGIEPDAIMHSIHIGRDWMHDDGIDVLVRDDGTIELF